MTIGTHIDAWAELRELSSRAGLNRQLASLQNLALGEQFMLADLLSFLSSRSVVDQLEVWQEERTDLFDLARLARIVGSPALRPAFPPPDPALRTAVRYRMYVGTHYLCALMASRRPVFPALQSDAQGLADFVQRLRLFLLVRALDAGAAGAWRESHLATLCASVRHVCEYSRHEKHEWLLRLPRSAVTYSSLREGLNSTSERILSSLKGERSERREFYRCLAQISSLRPTWRELVSTSAEAWHPIETPPAALASPPKLPRAWAETPDPEGPPVTWAAADLDGSVQTTVCFDAEEAATPAQIRRLGRGVMLIPLELQLFLPWSWHRLTQVERSALLRHLDQLLAPDRPAVDRLGACLTMLACLTSQTLTTVLALRTGTTPGVDWQLHPDGTHLHRLPPRFERRWRDRDLDGWVQPLAAAWSLKLPVSMRAVLRQPRQPERELAVRWADAAGQLRPELWLRATLAAGGPELNRISSPALASLVSLPVVQASSDACLGMTVASGSRSALPAAAAYGSYATTDLGCVRQAYLDLGAELHVSAQPGHRSINAAGSELQADIQRLRQAIAELRQSLESDAPDASHWLTHHNRLVALCVIAMLACTASRPVNSPFESISHFDFEAGLVFVDDKQRAASSSGRLCVLAEAAVKLVRDHYLDHLRALRDRLRAHAPALAAGIDEALIGDASSRMPLFFLLTSAPGLDWIEVTEDQLDVVCGHPWPLPWNLFRHLGSTWLRRAGLHPDIRDALLGHGDAGAEPHAAASLRVPLDDFERARPLINRLMLELGLSPPRHRPESPASPLLTGQAPDEPTSRRFGRKARALRRAQAQQRTRAEAEQDIRRALGGAPAQSLSSSQWEQIAHRMLVRDDGMPHSAGSLRYEVFEAYRERLWRQHGIRIPLTRMQAPTPQRELVFTEAAIGCKAAIQRLHAELDAMAAQQAQARPSHTLLAALTGLDVLLNSRHVHWPVVSAIVLMGPAMLVRWQHRWHLEVPWQGDWVDGKPVTRVHISGRAADWFSRSRHSAKRMNSWPSRPKALLGFGAQVAATDTGLEALLQGVAAVVRQLNILELPGALAAYLDGRRPSASLPHADWIRLTVGAAPAQPGPTLPTDSDYDADRNALEASYRRATPAPIAGAGSALGDPASRCRELFTRIRSALNKADQRVSARVTAINEAAAGSGFSRGDAPLMLAHFVVRMQLRPRKSGKGGLLRSRTTLRYWYSLATGFMDHAAAANLLELDDDELTELYAAIVSSPLDAGSVSDRPSPPSGAADAMLDEGTPQSELDPDVDTASAAADADADADASDSTDSSETSTDDAGGVDASSGPSGESMRALIQLRDFHEFAREEYGLPDPDWSEVAPDATVGSGRPGFISLREYRRALDLLVGQRPAEVLPMEALRNAFALMACARFGLRIGEAVGLLRSDWVDVADTTVVLVRPNSTRPLKTRHSRRQVPLVEPLQETERAIVREVLRRWELRAELHRDTALVPIAADESHKRAKARVSDELLPMLKHVTGNPGATVHHLRHAFANRMLSLLWGDRRLTSLMQLDADPGAARRLLLGSDTVDRRGLWAVARLLGHASPAITMSAYVHLLPFIAPVPDERSAAPSLSPKSAGVDLDRLPLNTGYLDEVPPTRLERPAQPESALLRRIRFLRMRALRRSVDLAADQALLPAVEARLIDQALHGVSGRIGLAPTSTPDAPPSILAHLSRNDWQRLQSWAAGAAVDPAHASPVGPDWMETVGSGRQILLFKPEHFKWLRELLHACHWTSNEVRLVRRPELHAALAVSLIGSGLDALTVTTVDHAGTGKLFQLDVARSLDGLQVYPHRVALLPGRGAHVPTTYSLLLLWTCWCVGQEAIG